MVADKLANAVHDMEAQVEDVNVFHLPPPVCKKQFEWDTQDIRFLRMGRL